MTLPPMLEDYFRAVETLRVEFGREVIVLMQVGSFYEIYECDGHGGHARAVAPLLGIHLTRKNSKLEAADDNPWMCGFPIYVLGKHISRLNDEGWTVAVYDQTHDNSKERVRRGVYTPSIRLDTEDHASWTCQNDQVDGRLFGIRVESFRCAVTAQRPVRFLISMIIVDLHTGRIQMNETNVEDALVHLEFVDWQFQPQDIVLDWVGSHAMELKQQFLHSQTSVRRIHDVSTETLPRHDDLWWHAFQIHAIHHEDVARHLFLDRHPHIVQCLEHVLLYIRKHDACLIQRLSFPEWIHGHEKTLQYNQDLFMELNIMDICPQRRRQVSRHRQKTLFDIVNGTFTPMGRRRLVHVLRFPITDVYEIQRRYQGLESLGSPHWNHLWQDFQALAKHTPDLEWMLLRWKRRKIGPKQVARWWQHCILFIDFLEKAWTAELPLPTTITDMSVFLVNVREAFTKGSTWWDLDMMAQGEFTFCRQPSTEMQHLLDILCQARQTLQTWHDRMNFAHAQDHSFKLVKLDTTYVFQTTKKRWDSVKTCPEFRDFQCTVLSGHCRLTHPELQTLSQRLWMAESQMERATMEMFYQQSEEWYTAHQTLVESLFRLYAELDYQWTCSHRFLSYRYRRPILDQEVQKSFLEIEELRHPIVEEIDPNRVYVPQHVSLSETNHTGYLIYGLNSSGKSTFLKSVGLAVWLAQCGFFVPAKSMRYFPVEVLMSKMGMMDNLYTGHSTFIAEMHELHYLLRRAQPHRSLMLCDELTAGTEIASAVGIVTATLRAWAQQPILYILTTHLQAVAKMPCISHLSTLRICHFHIDTERSPSLLVSDIRAHYERQLRDGPGPSHYGIEMADALGLPKAFVQMAFESREYMIQQQSASSTSHSVSKKPRRRRSRYNTRLLMSHCFVCKSTTQLHTHHILPQTHFERGDTHHRESKHGLYNLMVLCETCHQQLHQQPIDSTDTESRITTS